MQITDREAVAGLAQMTAADVHAACKSKAAIDDENLAVIAEVRIMHPARNQRRQKGVEVDLVAAEESLDGWKRVAGADVVDQHANNHAAVLRRGQRLDELPSGGIV